MKRIMLMVGIALLSGVGLYAQQAPNTGRGPKMTPAERATFTVQRMTATVTMTTEEQEKVTDIFKTFYTDQEPLRAERNRAKMLELATARDEKVKAVLNDETKYEAYLKFIAEQRGGRNRGKGTGRGGRR